MRAAFPSQLSLSPDQAQVAQIGVAAWVATFSLFTAPPQQMRPGCFQIPPRGSHAPVLPKYLSHCRSTCLAATEPSDSTTSSFANFLFVLGKVPTASGAYGPPWALAWDGVLSPLPPIPSHPIPEPQGESWFWGPVSLTDSPWRREGARPRGRRDTNTLHG